MNLYLFTSQSNSTKNLKDAGISTFEIDNESKDD